MTRSKEPTFDIHPSASAYDVVEVHKKIMVVPGDLYVFAYPGVLCNKLGVGIVLGIRGSDHVDIFGNVGSLVDVWWTSYGRVLSPHIHSFKQGAYLKINDSGGF